MSITPVPLPEVRIDGGTQPRAEINDSVVAEYVDAIRNGVTFPPVTLFFDGVVYWLADGFHRYHAHVHVGADSIDADVRQGDKRSAVLFSVGANANHGLRRTNEDKRNAVATLLRDNEWAAWSDREIARACAVGAPLVADVRRSICNPITDRTAARTVQRGSSVYQMDTDGIGGKKDRTTPSDNPVPTVQAVPAPVAAMQVASQNPKHDQAPEPDDYEDDGAPSADEIAAFEAQDRAEREFIEKLIASDDKLKAASDEVRRLNAIIVQQDGRIRGLINEVNAAKTAAKNAMRRAERAEREAAKAAQ